MGKIRRKNQGANQDQSASSSASSQIDSGAQESSQQAASFERQSSPATGASPAAAAQAQMLMLAQTHGNATALAAMEEQSGSGQEEEEGGHSREPSSDEETGGEPEESSQQDSGEPAQETSGEASGPPPAGTEDVAGGEPDPQAEEAEDPELAVQEEEGQEGDLEAEGEAEAAEEASAEPGEPPLPGVLTPPILPTTSPALGLSGKPSISFTLSAEEDEALLSQTGKAGSAHAAAANQALDGLTQEASALQAEAVNEAITLGAGVRASIEGFIPGLDQAVSTTSDQVAQGFDTGIAAIEASAAGAEAGVDAALGATQAALGARLAQNVAQVDAVAAGTQASLSGQEATWTGNFAAMETEYAAEFKQAPKDAASDILARKKTIGDEQKSGAGGAIERVLDQKRAQAGEILAEKAAEKIDADGEVKTPSAVEGMAEPNVVEDWMVPLQERVGTFRDESNTMLNETADASHAEIAAGGEAWKDDVSANEQAAVSQMEEDKTAAQGEIAAVGVQLRQDIESQAISQESLFVDTATELAETYRAHMDVVASDVEGLSFIKEEDAKGYVAEQQTVLQELHGENLTTLHVLAGNLTSSLTGQIDEDHTLLGDLLAQNQGDLEETVLANTAAFDEMGVVYGESLISTGLAVETEMESWVEPLQGQNECFVGEVETQLDSRFVEAEEGLSGALEEQVCMLDQEADAVGDNIDAEPVTQEVRDNMQTICEESMDAVEGMGTRENKLYNALRKIEDHKVTKNYSAAVEETWTDINGSSAGSMWYWIDDDMDGREQRIARKYYDGKTAEAAALELDYCTAWYNDDEEQIETILRTLVTKDSGVEGSTLIDELQGLPEWEAVGQELQDDLDGTDLNVVDALLVNNLARADAYRLKDAVDEARRKGDHDALHTALGGMDPGRREEIAQEFSYIRTDGAQASNKEFAKNMEEFSGEEGKAAALNDLAEYSTRTIKQVHYDQHGNAYERDLTIDGANKDLAVAQVMYGNDALETDVARFEVERTRSGGPKEENMEKALYMSEEAQTQLRMGDTDPDLQNAIAHAESVLGTTVEEHFGEFEVDELIGAGLPKPYAEAIIERRDRQRFSEIYEEKYSESNGGKNAEDVIRDIYSDSKHADLEIEAHLEMLEAGTNSPKVVALLTEITTNRPGTQDERLQRAWNNLTPEEADEAKKIWQQRPDLGHGKSLDDFLFNDTFSELSGDEAREMQEKMMGSEKYMTDEEKLELAAFRHDYHGDSDGGLHEKNIARHYEELQELRKTVAARPENNGSAYDADGYFLGTEDEKIRHRQLFDYIGITSRQEMAREDRSATAWTQAIAIVGGAVVIILTAGSATPLVIGAATLATGAASMGANAYIKGNRYGYEQAMVDGGVAVASALTAGYGAHLSRLNDVAKGGTGIVLAGRTLSENTGKIYISVVTSGVDGLVGALLDDKTWEESGGGISDVFLATAKGAGLDYAGGFIGDKLEAFGPIKAIAGEGTSTVRNMTQDAVKGYVEDFLKEGLSLGFDSATGKYKGDFGDILVAMNEAGIKGAGTGMLNGLVKRATPEDVFKGTRLGEVGEDGPTKTIGDALGEITGLVATHPDVVDQLDQLEASEEAASEQAEKDDSEQAARIEEGGAEGSPDEQAQILEEVATEKESMVEARSQEGQEEIQTLVEVVSDTEKKVEAEVEREAQKAIDAMDNAPAKMPEDGTSVSSESPALSDEDVANTVFESLNLTPDAVDHLGMLLDHEVVALIEYHKLHGDAGEVLKDADRIETVLGISPEDRALRTSGLDTEQPNPTKNANEAAEYMQKLEEQGSVVALEIVQGEPDLEKRAKMAKHFVELHDLTQQPVGSLNTNQLEDVIEANFALLQQYQVHESKLRRIVGDDELESWLRGQEYVGMKNGEPQYVETDRSKTGGSIGLAKNTEGLSVQEILSVLGLDYNGSSYVKKTDNGVETVESLFFVETSMTTEMMAHAKIPVGEDVYNQIEEAANSGDEKAQVLLSNMIKYDAGGERDGMNPYTGVGVTAPGDQLRGGAHAVAPELVIKAMKSDNSVDDKASQKVSLPAGSKLYHQTNDGNPIVVAVYKQDHDGRRYWEISPDCPEAFRDDFEKYAKQGKR